LIVLQFRSITSHWLGAFLFLAGLFALSGCSSTEPDNLSARPWNTPKGYESGLPVQMMQQGR